ncbi:MAG: hypothetical protein SGILL_001209 [Bacillariaceae sp.]
MPAISSRVYDTFDPSSWVYLDPSASDDVHETEHCVMLSNHTKRDALVRVVVFQKDGSAQLENLLVHYLQAVRYDEIVIVDHAGVDPKTKEITQKYVEKGVHLWRCTGTMEDKGGRWSEVCNVYKNDSQYIMPVDVDELMAIRTGFQPGAPFTRNDDQLVWNRKALKSELLNLPPSDGKPYKLLHAAPVPLDCHTEELVEAASEDLLTKHVVPFCKVNSIVRKGRSAISSCFDKNFFRGEDFQFTDVGNHHGHAKYRDCVENGTQAVYAQSNFVLVHFQVTSFSDWLLHALRLASDRGFNRLDEYECPPQHSNPNHACPLFQQLRSMNFSMYGMRELYRSRHCSDAKHWSYMSAANMTSMSCGVA